MKNNNSLNVLVYGAGAVGTTLAAWMASAGRNVWLLGRGESLNTLRQNPVTVTQGNSEGIGPVQLQVVDFESADPVADSFTVRKDDEAIRDTMGRRRRIEDI